MCWIGRVNDKRIAKKDKIVYKVFITTQGKNIKSNFRMEPYKRNTLYETKLGITTGSVENRKVVLIDEGFHSFETPMGAWELVGTMCFRKCETPLVTECIIPKGSIYYINSDMVVVSNKIIVTNEDCKW